MLPPPPDDAFGRTVPGLSINTAIAGPRVETLTTSPISYGRRRSKSFTSSSAAPPSISISSNKSSLELQKVLALLVSRIRDREPAPSVFEQFRSEVSKKRVTRVDQMVDSLRVAIKRERAGPGSKVKVPPPPEADSDDDEKDSNGMDFYTDATCGMMTQLRDILVMSHKQGWQIMNAGAEDFRGISLRPSAGSSPFRRRRSSAANATRPDITNPFRADASNLLDQCIRALGEVVSEDCRYKIKTTRLRTPPNALQVICLDVAMAILQIHNSPEVLASVGSAIIPAFYSFDPGLYPRLLAFFEESVLRGMLADLIKLQGASEAINMDPTAQTETSLLSNPSIVAIQVDPAHEEASQVRQTNWKQWSTSSPNLHVVSTSAPSQPIAVYRLASLVPPLLSAILDCLDIDTVPMETSYRLHRLFDLAAESKSDLHLDLLNIAAYHSERARRGAISLLMTFWPKAVGHVTIGKPHLITNYKEEMSRRDGIPFRAISDHPFAHQFAPWVFPDRPPQSARPLSGNVDPKPDVHAHCHACGDDLHGFGLACAYCSCAVHFNCYDSPEGSFLYQYPLASDPDTQRVAVIRFSRVLSSTRATEPVVQQYKGHSFSMINLFTMTICMACRLPLWGCVTQGMQCSSCRQFVHADCLDRAVPHCQTMAITSELITIDWTVLRLTFVEHYRDILLTEEQIFRHSYEDISVFHSVLWTQFQLFTNGIASGSIIVEQSNPSTQTGRDNRLDDFELQYCIRIYENYLSSGRLSKSATLEDHQRSRKATYDKSIFFDWPLLNYIAVVIKSAFPAVQTASSGNLLSVQPSDQAEESEELEAPFEIATLAHLRDALGHGLNIFSEGAARHMLTHLHAVGLFHRVDRAPLLFKVEDKSPTEVYCTFPIPSLLDMSVDVETLVAAIESCLEDIDISINEVGFLLLRRKCWPNIWASDYGLNRLAQAMLTWIFTEDHRLLVVARDFVAQKRPLPGVQPGSALQPWPIPHSRVAPSNAASSGGDYLACRRLLAARFVVPWMQALQQQDSDAYSALLFENCANHAGSMGDFTTDLFGHESQDNIEARRIAWGDSILKLIVRICHSGVIFSSFDTVFVAWLDATSSLGTVDLPVVYPSLPRLFNMESDSPRFSMVVDPLANAELLNGINVHPWRVITDTAAEGKDDLQRALDWLKMLAQSGVSIPISIIMQMTAFARDFESPFEAYKSLIEAVLATCWLRSSGAQELIEAITSMHERLAQWIAESFASGNDVARIHQFLRLSLASCLLLYGFDREAVTSVGLLPADETKGLPSRRKYPSQGAMAPSTLASNIDLVNMLTNYVHSGPEEICETILIFLNTLVSDISPLEPQDIDNLVSINGYALSRCAWKFYDLALLRISTLRTTFLLRLLIVDTSPFEILLTTAFVPDDNPELRHTAVNRLFRIILDVNGPHFQLEDRQWRPSVVFMFYFFFKSLWDDPEERIRLAVDIASQTLFPAHFAALSRCWDEYLTKATLTERVRLVSFLIQLRPYFPTWRLLSWETVVEAILEDDFVSNRGGADDDIYAHLLSPDVPDCLDAEYVDVSLLRVLLVSLSLQLVGDGIPIDSFTLLTIKKQLAKILGFSNCQIASGPGGAPYVQFDGDAVISEVAYPCASALVRALDGEMAIDLSPSTMGIALDSDIPQRTLVGAVFSDIMLSVMNTIVVEELPYLPCRAWLEALIIFILKYDLESPVLRHLSTPLVEVVKRLSTLVLLDTTQDLRQLALSIWHALLKTWPNLSAKILSRQIFTACNLITQFEMKSEHILVAQSKAFLEVAFLRFAPYGLFKSLFKRDPLPEGFIDVLQLVMKENAKGNLMAGASGENLQDTIMRNTLERLFDNRDGDHDLPILVSNILRHLSIFVEKVHHQNYSDKLMADLSLALTNVARRTAEWHAKYFDPNPLFKLATTVVQHNKAQSRDVLLHMETFLRSSLVRFDVKSETLGRIFTVTSTLYRRASTIAFDIPPNHLAMAVLEILTDELRGKGRATSKTFVAMLEAAIGTFASDHPLFQRDVLLQISTDALNLISTPPLRERFTETHLSIFVRSADLILHTTLHDQAFLNQLIGSQSNRPTLPLRVWNSLAIAAIEKPQFAAALLVHVPAFSLSYSQQLQSLVQTVNSNGWTEHVAVDVSNAYVAIKLWMILARQSVRHHGDSAETVHENLVDKGDGERWVWNEVWPPFERLVTLSVSPSLDDISPIATTVWASYVDLIVFLHQFRSVVALESGATHIALLRDLASRVSHDASVNKFNRAAQAMSNPPLPLPFATLVDKVHGDLMVAEKLANAFEVRRRREGGERKREGGDRRRHGHGHGEGKAI